MVTADPAGVAVKKPAPEKVPMTGGSITCLIITILLFPVAWLAYMVCCCRVGRQGRSSLPNIPKGGP